MSKFCYFLNFSDLIDYQSSPDGLYKYVLVAQDHATKFVVLRSLCTKEAPTVASHLFEIFCCFGAPKILHSDNGREFVNQVIQELKTLWPELVLVNGKPRHPQSQGSVERANADIIKMIAAWMNDNNSRHWLAGLPLVQFRKNTGLNRNLGMSP